MIDLDCALLAQAIYSQTGFDRVESLPCGVVLGIKLMPDGETIAAFRGTDNPLDILKDLEVVPVFIPGLGLVHSGFYLGVPEAVVFLKSLGIPGGKLKITGHSLGAAQAMLAAGSLARDGMPVARVVGFGTPRSAGPDMNLLLQKTTPGAEYWNIISDTHLDPVPTLTTDLPFRRCYEPTIVRVVPKDSFVHLFRYHKIANYVTSRQDDLPGMAGSSGQSAIL